MWRGCRNKFNGKIMELIRAELRQGAGDAAAAANVRRLFAAYTRTVEDPAAAGTWDALFCDDPHGQ